MGVHGTESDREFEHSIVPLLRSAAGYAYAIVRRRQDAEDAVQDAVLKAYAARDRYDPSRNFKAWWFAIVRRCSIDLLRRRGALAETDPADLPAPACPQDRSDLREELTQALQQLSPAHKEILELRYFGECSYREIADSLSIPPGTVMSRLHAARQALAAVYRKEHV